MSTLRAAQLIYSRVEPDYSPQRKSGFQTVYKSDSLTGAEVSQIEKRVQCFQPGQPNATRYQFFIIESGAIVLTHSVLIETHPEIVDRDSRGGVFVAHCLILSRADFDKVDFNPFTLLQMHNFVENAEAMVAQFGQASGVAPELKIEAERWHHPPSTSWSGSEAQKLATLAIQADQLIQKGQAVLLIGAAHEVTEALQIAFWFTPKHRRLACTFDTCVDRCLPRPVWYWALGATTRQSSNVYLQVHASERRVMSQVDNNLDNKDMYLVWLKQAIQRHDFGQVIKHASTTQTLAQAFAEHTQPQLKELDEAACHDFMELHAGPIRQSLEVALAQVVGKNVATVLSGYLPGQIDTLALLDMAASQRINLVELSAFIVNWLIDERPELNDGDWKKLQSLARQGQDMRLLHLAAILSKKVDAKIRDEALSEMNGRTFRQALEQLLEPIAPADLVTRAHLSTLLADQRLRGLSGQQLVDLVEAILEIDAAQQLDDLAVHVKGLENKPLAQLEKIIKKQGDLPPKFTKAVRARRAELGPPPRLLGLF
jgi:hypothetical protein